MKYEDIINKRAYEAFIQVDSIIDAVSKLEKLGWGFQSLSYQIFKECGIYELYISNETLNGRSISDRIADAFYQSTDLDEVYDKINYILLQIESKE